MVTPGLRIDATGNTIQPTIRGITTTLSQVLIGVGDRRLRGWCLPSRHRQTAHLELPDVQQIEVLKGPQGTLFGRNATGGAILIQTLQPNLTNTAAQASLSYGNYNDVIAKNLRHLRRSSSDKLAMSATAHMSIMTADGRPTFSIMGSPRAITEYLFRTQGPLQTMGRCRFYSCV
jgi:iron complex outermembrane receptor protein